MKDALGRQWQLGTIQLDFQLPLNFDLEYVAPDGTHKRPVMIHRAIFGSMERFIGILIEHFKGAFPFWLSPVQVGVVPIRQEHNDYAKKVVRALKDAGIRTEVDYADKNMNEKIKFLKNMKEPLIVVVGDKEAESETVSVTVRGQKQQMHDVSLTDFVKLCQELNSTHAKELPVVQ